MVTASGKHTLLVRNYVNVTGHRERRYQLVQYSSNNVRESHIHTVYSAYTRILFFKNCCACVRACVLIVPAADMHLFTFFDIPSPFPSSFLCHFNIRSCKDTYTGLVVSPQKLMKLDSFDAFLSA